MKYTTILSLLFLLHNSFIFAQSKQDKNYGKISYERILNYDNEPVSTMFSLFINPKFSVFSSDTLPSKESSTKEETHAITENPENPLRLSWSIRMNSRSIVLTDFRKDSIQSQVSLFRDGKEKTYIVGEKIKKIKWDITNEFKTISGFKSQKAVGLFRGRKYTAWFTNEIPIQYGPWKLNGLPGLILNASDDKNEVMFYARKITIPYISKSDLNINFEFSNKHEKISLKEYLTLENEEIEEIQKLINAKLPRGAEFHINSVESDAIELKYEEKIKD